MKNIQLWNLIVQLYNHKIIQVYIFFAEENILLDISTQTLPSWRTSYLNITEVIKQLNIIKVKEKLKLKKKKEDMPFDF